MYNKLKYNAMVALLVTVIGIFLGATSLRSNFTKNTLNPNLDHEHQTELDNNQNQMPTGKFSPPSETANPFTRIAFAFNVLKQGEGFSSETFQTVNSMGQIQNIFTKTLRAEDKDFMEEWQYSNTSFAQNQFILRYSDGVNVKSNIIRNKAKFSASAKNYEEGFADESLQLPAKDFVGLWGNFNDFPLTINETTSSLERYDRISDKNNYVITVSFNVNKIDATHLRNFEDNGTLGLKFKTISITFKINKKTGFFSSITKHEEFSAVYSGIPVNCIGDMTITYITMNTSMKKEIEDKVARNFI